MKLYNTLTRKVEEFQPTDDKKVGIYSCGPTVYDHIHIGNLSAFIVADTLRRVISHAGYNVKHVMNITDVSDKVIQRSNELYPGITPEEALHKLGQEYSQIFINDTQAVGNDTDSLTFIKATDSIPAMQQLITQLVLTDFAYIADDGVYFSISKYKESGKIYGQLTDITESSTSIARIQNDEYDKESIHDFALWKKQKPGEPAWEFEIDGQDLKGRPGWHIECSAMSTSSLGQPFDIHTGGVDLIFPHHENEIAQSTAGKDNPLYARFFVHNEHILIDGKKMSKSLNNFYTLKDIVDKGYDPLAFRLLVLQSHYRNQAHFSWENLEAAQNRLKRFRNFAVRKFQETQTEKGPLDLDMLLINKFKIMPALEDDLNTPVVLKYIEELIDSTENELIKDKKFLIEPLIKILDVLLGLDLSSETDITDEQKQLIAERQSARDKNDWAKSDVLREKLATEGLGIRDTDTGSIWYRL